MFSENRSETINSWKGEWIYALVIDRFHDGRERTLYDNHTRTGFGNAADLRETCGGTLNGIRKKIPYIKELGCTSILLTPFLENNSEHYHGYAIQDFLRVDARFGTLEELKALVQEAHDVDMRVIMDVVLNHTGNNWSYIEERTPYRKRKPYTFSHWHHEDKPQPLALRNEAWYSKRGQIVHWDKYPESWDGDIFELKDLVWDDTVIGWEVLECMVGVYSYWIKETGVDGFRLDALKHIRPVMANAFCNRIKAEAKHFGKEHFILIGEVVGNMELISQYTELHAFFNFPFYFNFLQGIKKKNLYETFGTYSQDYFLPVNYLDNHDQIGLEPKKRISDLLTDEQLLGSLFLMGLEEGINCLYYGTEQGLRTLGVQDHDVRECLFDPYGEMELFDESHTGYQKLRTVIGLVTLIKKSSDRIERLELEPGLHVIECKFKDQLVYKIFFNSSYKNNAALLTLQDEVVFSTHDAMLSSTLKPMELRVYQVRL